MTHIEKLIIQAADHTDAITAILTSVGAGTTRNDFAVAATRFHQLHRDTPALLDHCAKIQQHIEVWLHKTLGLTLTGRPTYPLPDDIPTAAPFTLPEYPLHNRLDRHVFEGERRGRLISGLHHLHDGALPDGLSLEGRYPNDRNGVWKANVRQVLPNGRILVKSHVTFFPNHWTRAEVAHAIRVAFASRTRPAQQGDDRISTWEGEFRGVRIRGFVTPGLDAMSATTDDVRTAWPLYEGGPERAAQA
ncbi:EndoU domain-containing protein [Goodfellowiella coeruleoviolacea]|uniref:EndoU nuclease n=1 Tax=Goodfellowiella coeruleoviolacea TaxID=334858 RepID=A0AAE3G9Y5_9PSEU|nr:EndoU domain-containing protein [Goodfellowiella coeruleoviolacea]MCP2164387.1 EndoU nuclease [Goodfellowiella coeruleoviolacea]